MLGKIAAGAGPDAQETPEGTPGPQTSSQAVAAADDFLAVPPPVPWEDEDDDDYAPGKKAKKKERTAKPRGAKRQSESAGPSAEAPASGKGKGRGKKAAQKEAAVEQVNKNRVYHPAKLKAVVDEAKFRAHEQGKPNLALAVEDIYQQSLTDTRICTLLERILLQNATPDQKAEFQEHVKRTKKKLKDAKRAVEPQGGDKDLPLRSPAKDAQITTIKDESPAIPSTEKSEAPRPKLSIKVKSPPKPTASRGSSQGGPASSSPIKPKSEDVGDNSDLSELTELSEGEEMAVDTPEEVDEMSTGSASAVKGVKGKGNAGDAGSLGVPSGNLKRSSADAEIQETEEDRALSAKKLKLSNTIQRDYDFQESHLRGSLTRPSRGAGAKNGAGAPPKITLHPNGGGNVSTRGNRAISAEADSPLSSPAMSSRRSTPHVWRGPPPKQTGKRAKTKTS